MIDQILTFIVYLALGVILLFVLGALMQRSMSADFKRREEEKRAKDRDKPKSDK